MSASKPSAGHPPPTTPGRPDPSSSRQQTHPDQATQTGSSEIDAESKDTAKPTERRRRQ